MAKAKDRSVGNEHAARITLADPERYAGLPLEWARLWMERHGNSAKERAAAGAKKHGGRPQGRLMASFGRPKWSILIKPSGADSGCGGEEEELLHSRLSSASE